MAKRFSKSTSRELAVMPPELDTEVANRLRDPFETTYLGVLRTNDPLLLERGGNATEVYRDLERDGKVFSGLQKRKLAVISRPWQVEAIVDTPKGKDDAKKVSDILKALNFDGLCTDLLDAVLMGFSPAEIVWSVRDGMVVPARVVARAQRRFVYQQTNPDAKPDLRLLTANNMITGEALPERKFVVHRFNPKDDNPYGTGLGLQLYWPVFFKRKGIISWNKLNDRFGSPTPWGKYPRGASPKEKGTLFDALRAMSNDGLLMTPEGVSIELLESKLTGTVNTQQSLCEYMDDWIMEVILGQAPRTKGGGALAAASSEREDVRAELSQADSDLMSDTINSTLMTWICEYNGFELCQVSRVIKRAEDLKAASETDTNVAGLGFKMTLEGVRSKYGEHWEPADPVSPNAALVPKPASNFAEGDIPPTADALDALIDAEQDQWQPSMEPLVDPIRQLLAEAAQRGYTAGQVADALPALLAEMDVKPLADSLTRTAFVGRLGAYAGIPNE